MNRAGSAAVNGSDSVRLPLLLESSTWDALSDDALSDAGNQAYIAQSLCGRQ
jgi:hypothetical protein